MRAYENTAKTRRKIGFNEEQAIQLVAFNLGRGYTPTFEDWFDNNEKLDLTKIFDCASQQFKFDFNKYGNNSTHRGAASILSGKGMPNDDNLNEKNYDIPREDDGRPEETDDPDGWLGSYRRMQSPGILRLNLDNIQIFFWDIICRMACKDGYEFTRIQITELARLSIYKTLYHELFHHFMDVQSYIVANHKFKRMEEEALAVACSRILVGFESKYNRLYVSDFLNEAYSYTAPGYKDWERYRSDEQFILGVMEYMPLENNKKGVNALLKNGQYVGPIIEGMLYGVIENPNIEFDFRFNR